MNPPDESVHLIGITGVIHGRRVHHHPNPMPLS